MTTTPRHQGVTRRLPSVSETSAGGVVIDVHEGRARIAIIARRNRSGRVEWCLPKGHVEPGETIAPRRNIPKAARRFIWRLAIFYGLGSLMIGCIVPWDEEDLLSPESNANSSPWVLGIQRAGIKVLNHIINAAILTSAMCSRN